MRASEGRTSPQLCALFALATLSLMACSQSHTAGLSQGIEGPDTLRPEALENAPLSFGQGAEPTPCEVIEDCDDGNPCTDALCIDGLCSLSPSPDPMCCHDGVLSFHAFDPEGAEGYDFGEPGAGDVWALSSARALSPPTSLHFGDPDQGRMSSPEPISASFQLPPLTLPAEAEIEMSFWIYADISSELSRDDLSISAQVMSIDGLAQFPLRILTKSAMPDAIYEGFARVSLSLSDFAGHTIRLSFNFESVAAPNPAHEGIFIDDIEILTACQKRASERAGEAASTPPSGLEADAPHEEALVGTEGEDAPAHLGDEGAEGADDESGAVDQPSTADPGSEPAPEGGGAGATPEEEGSEDALPAGADDGNPETTPPGEGSSDGSSSSEAGPGPSGEGADAEGAESGAPGALVSGDSPSNPCAAPDAHEGCCISDADCDDGNPQTLNVCEGAECVATWAPSGCDSDAECGDGEACTLDRCVEGVCVYEGTYGAACCVPGSVSIASFDDESLEGIYVTDNLETGVFWRPDPTRSTDGGFSLYCGDPVSQSYGIGERVKSSATTPLITLPVGGQTQLSFDLFMATRPFSQLDVFQAFVLHQGTLIPVWSSKVFSSGNTMGFLPITVDLSGYAGQEIQLRFVFDSVDSHAESFEGTYLDRIRLDTTCD